jgi:ABC-type Mn2+/Zn2+ transport system permease subunit/Mn-dependent DtxR family transcriptional regulator
VLKFVALTTERRQLEKMGWRVLPWEALSVWRWVGWLVGLMGVMMLSGCGVVSGERAVDFVLLRDGHVRAALPGVVLLGLNCGLLGTLLIARRLTMLGDTLSHAVLPGIAAGFLWTMTKHPGALLIGALVTGVLSSLVTGWILGSTRLKADAAQSVVLTVFFAAGIVMIKLLPDGSKAGLDRFLYGQAAALDAGETVLLAVAAALSVVVIWWGYRGFLVLAFDPGYGRAAGLPVKGLHLLQMFLTTLAVVVSMQAVGVILVAGLLVIPGATAWLFSARLHRVLVLAALLGMAAAVMGTFLSFAGDGMAMGPTLVLCAGVMFGGAFLLSPRYGMARRMVSVMRHGRRVRREDGLKAVYRVLEGRGFSGAGFGLEECGQSEGMMRSLERRRMVREVAAGGWELTESGFREAARVVRNHRLWELYLTRRAGFAEDHVHDAAEEMEHLLAEENIEHLMGVLGHPERDPHGRRIPGAGDTIESSAARHE